MPTDAIGSIFIAVNIEDEKEKYSPQGGSLSDRDTITFSNPDRKRRQMQRQVDSLSSFILLTGSAIFLMLIVE